MLKLDISKVFDSVSWEFLLNLMAFRGFSQKVEGLDFLPFSLVIHQDLGELLHDGKNHALLWPQGG